MRALASVLLASTSLVAFTADGLAADMKPRVVTKAPALAPVTYFNWTGCYVGGHGGWGWGRKDVVQIFSSRLGTELMLPLRDDVDGFLGGVQAGCDYQFSSNWLIGVDGQFSWGDINGDVFLDPFLTGKASNGTFSAKVDRITTVSGRLGFAWDRWLIYGKGGAAWAHDKYNVNALRCGNGCVQPIISEASETRTGWLAGAGIEYAFAGNWSAKIEYNYMDFGKRTVTFTGSFNNEPTPTTDLTDIDQRIQLILVGVNYRFLGRY